MNIYSKADHRRHIIEFIVFIVILFGSIGTVLYFLPYRNWKEYQTKPEKKIKVEYTIYAPTKEIKKTGIYKMRGESFAAKNQGFRGRNELYIYDTSDKDGYLWGEQQIKIYDGTIYAEVEKITIVE